MSIEKYLMEVTNEGFFFNKTPKEYAKIERTVNDLYKFGSSVESVINKLGIEEFYPTIKSARVPNKITPKNETIERFKRGFDEGKHDGFIAVYPVLTWKYSKSKEDNLKKEMRHLYERLTSIVDLKDPGTVLAYGNYQFSVLEFPDDRKDCIMLILKTHHVFDNKK